MLNTNGSSPPIGMTPHSTNDGRGPVSPVLISASGRHLCRPPGFLEIVGLPILGAVAIEILHSRKNELVLFFIPFAIAGVRLFIAQFQVPSSREKVDETTLRARRVSVAFNQVAVFAAYVTLRLQSRKYWIRAAIDPSTRGTLD